MLKTHLPAFALAFITVMAAGAVPAFATSTSKALSICVSRGTDCAVSNKGGGYEICVNNTGGKQCVSCPALTSSNQTCTTAAKAGKRPTAFGVETILQRTSK